MLGVTVFGLFMTPVFYAVVGSLAARCRAGRSRSLAPRRCTRPRRNCDDADAWSLARRVCRRSLAGAACARLIEAPELAPVVVRNADPALFVDAAVRPALVAPVRRPGARTPRRRRAAVQPRRAHGRGARRPGARDLPGRRARSVSDGRRGRQRRSPPAGDSRVSPRSQCARRPTRPGSTRSGRSTSLAACGPRCEAPPPTAEGLEASLEDVRVIVAAEVARNYFELRGLQQQLAVAERSLINQRETLRLTEVRRRRRLSARSRTSPAPPRVSPPSRPACRRSGSRSPSASTRWRC